MLGKDYHYVATATNVAGESPESKPVTASLSGSTHKASLS